MGQYKVGKRKIKGDEKIVNLGFNLPKNTEVTIIAGSLSDWDSDMVWVENYEIRVHRT